MINRKLLIVLGLLATAVIITGCERPVPRFENPALATDVNVVSNDPLPEPDFSIDDTLNNTGNDVTLDSASGDSGATESDGSDVSGDENAAADEVSNSDENSAAAGDNASAADNNEATTSEENTTTDDSSDDTSGEVDDSPDTSIPTKHTVAAGENLYRIGLKYNLSWLELAQENGIRPPYRLTVGQVLQLTGAGTDEPRSEETTYVVKSGDTLYSIGVAHGVSWVQIAEANGISEPTRIVTGDTLKIPVNAPGPSPQFSHTVRSGETLYSIAIQYGVSWTELAAENNVSSPYIIFPGTLLQVPGNE